MEGKRSSTKGWRCTRFTPSDLVPASTPASFALNLVKNAMEHRERFPQSIYFEFPMAKMESNGYSGVMRWT